MNTKQHKLFYGSSYDRGLQHLLFMWPEIKEKYPDAELHICYGWDLFMKFYHNNQERMQWKKGIDMMINQKDIFHYGRVGKEKLHEIRAKCGIWAYPTDFDEINCITAIECQNDGLVPIVINKAALSETVQSGIKVDGDITKPEVAKNYLDALLQMMGDEKLWLAEQDKAKRWASKHLWDKIANKWVDCFDTATIYPSISIITPTIREGFWNIMADNIAKQNYPHLEWIIIDDHPQDRSDIAKKYAVKYSLNIRYYRGNGSLAKGNNIGWKKAKGELLIWLQDFVMMRDNNLHDLAMIYKRNPDALLAPIDEYWYTIAVNKDNKEDWYDGKTDVVTTLSWKNIRQQHEGCRKSTNPMDFELNFGAIPKKTLDALGGWYDEWDEKMGYDNTEIALRALKLGYDILVDDTIIATCFDINGETQGSVKTKPELWEQFVSQIDTNQIPLQRK